MDGNHIEGCFRQVIRDSSFELLVQLLPVLEFISCFSDESNARVKEQGYNGALLPIDGIPGRLEEMKKDFVSCINISLHIVQFGFSGRVPESSVAVFDDTAADIIDALQCVDIFQKCAAPPVIKAKLSHDAPKNALEVVARQLHFIFLAEGKEFPKISFYHT